MPQFVFTFPSEDKQNHTNILDFLKRMRDSVIGQKSAGSVLNSNVVKELIAGNGPSNSKVETNIDNNNFQIKFVYPNKTYWEYKIAIPESWEQSNNDWVNVYETPL